MHFVTGLTTFSFTSIFHFYFSLFPFLMLVSHSCIHSHRHTFTPRVIFFFIIASINSPPLPSLCSLHVSLLFGAFCSHTHSPSTHTDSHTYIHRRCLHPLSHAADNAFLLQRSAQTIARTSGPRNGFARAPHANTHTHTANSLSHSFTRTHQLFPCSAIPFAPAPAFFFTCRSPSRTFTPCAPRRWQHGGARARAPCPTFALLGEFVTIFLSLLVRPVGMYERACVPASPSTPDAFLYILFIFLTSRNVRFCCTVGRVRCCVRSGPTG